MSELFSAAIIAQCRRHTPQPTLYVVVAFNAVEQYWAVPSTCERWYETKEVALAAAKRLSGHWTEFRIYELKGDT